jgi:hypothetical protein
VITLRGEVVYWLALACAVAAGAAPAGERKLPDGRVLYALNCLGCHPMPDAGSDNSRFSSTVEGEFAQTPPGRMFFMRMPALYRPLSRLENEKLLAEVNNWKRACPLLLGSTSWSRSNLK